LGDRLNLSPRARWCRARSLNILPRRPRPPRITTGHSDSPSKRPRPRERRRFVVEDVRQRLVLLTPMGSNNSAQGRRRRTLGIEPRTRNQPQRGCTGAVSHFSSCEPVWPDGGTASGFTGAYPGCAARPWALMCDAFGVGHCNQDEFFRGFPGVPWLKDRFTAEKPIASSASSNILAGEGCPRMTMPDQRECLDYGRSGYITTRRRRTGFLTRPDHSVRTVRCHRRA